MAKESDFQKKIVKWLRSQKCFVWKMQQNATTRVGVSDLFFCKEGFYGFIEVKKNKSAKRQPGQEVFVKKMNEWSWAKVVWPDIWPDVQNELKEILK